MAGPTAIEKAADAGNPVVTVNWLDWVLSAGEAMLAVTRTTVCTVPELTTVCTVPSEAVVAVAGDRLIPPTVLSSANVTVTPDFAPPVESNTLNMTVEVSFSPVPFKPMVVGVAETNSIDPMVEADTLTVAVADTFCMATVALAVMTSEPLQPVAAYVALMLPEAVVMVVTGVELPEGRISARPEAMQGELKLTTTGAPV